jgi:hypothetical protein
MPWVYKSNPLSLALPRRGRARERGIIIAWGVTPGYKYAGPPGLKKLLIIMGEFIGFIGT